MALTQRRVHVGARDWDNAAATDYWLNANGLSGQTSAASATNPYGLSGWSWTTTSLTVVTGGTGDLNSSGDVDPVAFGTNAANDALRSPKLFGGYDQFQRVADILGYSPTILRAVMYARFSTIGANENTTGFGFMTGTDFTAAGSVAGIISDNTNFLLKSDNGSDTGAAKDTSWHKFQIDVGGTNTEWFIDGTSQGTITTETDIYPTQFKLIAGTTNRVQLSWLHILYV